MPYKRGQQARYRTLITKGFTDWEAKEFSLAYPTFQYSTDKHSPSVYLRRMINSRYHMVIQLSRLGYSPEMVDNYIHKLYYRNGWFYADGKPNPYRMLEYYRDKAIASGDYFPKARRHGLRGRSISKGDVAGQRSRAKAREKAKKGLPISLAEYEKGRMR